MGSRPFVWFALASALLLAGSGCATVHPRSHQITYSGFGDLGSKQAHERETLDRLKQLREDLPTFKPAHPVKILVDTFPEGLELEGDLLKVKPGFRHEVLGQFTLEPNGGHTGWFSDYASVGRKIYCYPQVPLTWVTLGLWQIFVPLSYPCLGGGLKTAEATVQLEALAEAAGANVVVVQMKTNQEWVRHAHGFLVHADPAVLDPGREEPPASRNEL